MDGAHACGVCAEIIEGKQWKWWGVAILLEDIS